MVFLVSYTNTNSELTNERILGDDSTAIYLTGGTRCRDGRRTSDFGMGAPAGVPRQSHLS